MNTGTRILFILFCIYRQYKRLGAIAKRRELIFDLRKCYLILKRFEQNIDPNVSIKEVQFLINRINGWGYEITLTSPLKYSDYYDHEIIKSMIQLTKEIIDLAKHQSFYKQQHEIFLRLTILHNLPRVLLNNSSGDASVSRNFHITKQEALDSFLAILDEDQSLCLMQQKI